jgi:hypothetical protein
MRDLYTLVADDRMRAVVEAFLRRPEALGIRPVTFHIGVHRHRDPGIVKEGPEEARLQRPQYTHALLVWDYACSGPDKKKSPEEPEVSARGLQRR